MSPFAARPGVSLKEAPGLAGRKTQVLVIVFRDGVPARMHVAASRPLGPLPPSPDSPTAAAICNYRDAKLVTRPIFSSGHLELRLGSFRSRATRRSLRGSVGSRGSRHVGRVDRLGWSPCRMYFGRTGPRSCRCLRNCDANSAVSMITARPSQRDGRHGIIYLKIIISNNTTFFFFSYCPISFLCASLLARSLSVSIVYFRKPSFPSFSYENMLTF